MPEEFAPGPHPCMACRLGRHRECPRWVGRNFDLPEQPECTCACPDFMEQGSV